MKPSERLVISLSLALIAFALILHLGVNLKRVQLDEAAAFNYDGERQSVKRVQLGGVRGRILDRNGLALAENRAKLSLVLDVALYQASSRSSTVARILRAIDRAGECVGRRSSLTAEAIRSHLNRSRALPLTVVEGLKGEELARFAERETDFPGISILERPERYYPAHRLAAHVIGYVGRDRGEVVAGEEHFNYYSTEMRGRKGLEAYYDSFLCGMPGEKRVQADARGYTVSERIVVEPQRGPDLVLALDLLIQRKVEQQLAGLRGACVVMDPRTGEVLAMASAPGYDPNEFVPRLEPAVYRRYAEDPAKPLLDRAAGGAYAPGSTFKPITALAGLSVGYPENQEYPCSGVYTASGMNLRCASRWGHGNLDLRHALMLSCNPFFCNLGAEAGTNALLRTARAFGLGAKTGIDYVVDMAGALPTAEWKERMYHERWYAGDLLQMSIGQGMLLVSPLQMVRVAAAIGTGYLVTPHLKRDLPVERRPLPFAAAQLKVVREGMRLVVAGEGERHGSGWRAGVDLPVAVSGKTGTAEVGIGERRRKNTWFIAYAPSERPTVAVAMVIENGDTGGGTTAPRVGEVLKEVFRAR